MDWTFDQVYPFLLVAGFIGVLNILFCCYLMKLRREGASEIGFRRVTYSKRMTNEVCAVCLEEFRENESVGQCPCKHNFHVGCVSQWLDSHETCPICQTKVRVGRDSERTRLLEV